jgi:hypothetical protein
MLNSTRWTEKNQTWTGLGRDWREPKQKDQCPQKKNYNHEANENIDNFKDLLRGRRGRQIFGCGRAQGRRWGW